MDIYQDNMKIERYKGKPYNKMSQSELALMYKLAHEQGDTIEAVKIIGIYKKRFNKK